MAFRATDGAFLWQDVSPRVERGLRQFLLPSTTGAPYVEGHRLCSVSPPSASSVPSTHKGSSMARTTVQTREELFQDMAAADIVWELDICGRLGVFPHEATNSEVLPLGDLLMVSTSNGRNEGHTRVPSPRAPSLIAVDKHLGDVIWRATGAGGEVLHGQWSSPVAIKVDGRLAGYSSAAAMGGCGRTTRCRVRKSGDSTAIPKTPAGCRAPASCRGVDHCVAGLR